MKLYQVVGRKAPKPDSEVEEEVNPSAYRIKIFAPNEMMAKSRFWYFMHAQRKMKKTTGEILDVNEIVEKNSRYVKNFGIWVKYNSRSGTHNMYREYRATSLTKAVEMLYDDMAGRHRARQKSIQIVRTATVADKDCKRIISTAFHNNTEKGRQDIKFPMPHRIIRAASKASRPLYTATRPHTHYN
jgi:large subunit ribosomal protein L18Ae